MTKCVYCGVCYPGTAFYEYKGKIFCWECLTDELLECVPSLMAVGVIHYYLDGNEIGTSDDAPTVIGHLLESGVEIKKVDNGREK